MVNPRTGKAHSAIARDYRELLPLPNDVEPVSLGESVWLELRPRGIRRGEGLAIVAQHNSYHLGQIVMLRRVLGAWPPPAGGDTW